MKKEILDDGNFITEIKYYADGSMFIRQKNIHTGKIEKMGFLKKETDKLKELLLS